MQSIKISFLLFCLFLCSTASYPQDTARLSPGQTLTLSQCVEIALKNNLQVAQSELTMQSSGISRNQALSNLLPSVNASANQGTNFGKSINPTTYTYINQTQNTGNYGLNAGITLFSGLTLQNAIKMNQYMYDASKMDWQQQKDNITLNVLLAYLQVLSSGELLGISREQAAVDAKNVERLEILNREGAIAPSTLYDLKGQFANDQVNIINGINALESAKIFLFQILNIPYQRDIVFEKIPTDISVADYQPGSDSLYQTALHTLPVIKSVDLRIKAQQKAIQVNRGQYFPTLSFYGSVSSNYSDLSTTRIAGTVLPVSTGDYVTVNGTNYNVITQQQEATYVKTSFGDQFKNNRYTQIGLSLQIPILNYLHVRNNIKQAKVNLKNAVYVADNTRLQLQQNVELAYQNMIAARGQFASYTEQFAAYNESLRAADVKFRAGAITSVDYVIAKNNADRASLNLVAARYNLTFRARILDYYRGSLRF